MKNIFLFFGIIFSIQRLVAQQEPVFSFYLYNPVVVNPAYAGSLNQFQAVGVFRRQWTNFPGSPSTGVLSLHGPLQKSQKAGMGMTFSNDRFGNIQTNAINVMYSYKVKFEKSTLAFGISSSLRNFNVDFSESRLSISNNFDEAFSENISSWHLNFGSGLFWFGENWFAGLSVPHFRAHQIGRLDLQTTPGSFQRGFYMINGGLILPLHEEWKLKPSLAFRSQTGAPIQADINASAYYGELFSFGLSYRTRDAIVILGDLRVNKNLRVGYAFDQVLTKLSGRVGGTHEFFLRYDFTFDSGVDFNPRLF